MSPADPTVRPDREGAEREICDAIDGVLQWRESATSWSWLEDEYHEMARAALDAIGYDELVRQLYDAEAREGRLDAAEARNAELVGALSECGEQADHAEDELLSICPYFTGDADRRAAAIAAVQAIVTRADAALSKGAE